MRSYKQYCGVAYALDLVGSRWTLLILRDLLPGPRRFTDLKRPGLTPNVLSQRLRELSDAGLVEPVVLAPWGTKAWGLTEQGATIEPVILALGSFGASYMGPPDDRMTSPRWFVVSLRRRFAANKAATLKQVPKRVQLLIDATPYKLQLTSGQPWTIQTLDGTWDDPDLVLTGSLPDAARLFQTGQGPMLPSVGLHKKLAQNLASCFR